MTNLIKILPSCLLVFSTISIAQPPTPPSGYQWEVVPSLTDEFNDNTIDGNKWLKYNPSWVGRDPGRFKQAQVSEDDGFLQLKNRKIADTSELNR